MGAIAVSFVVRMKSHQEIGVDTLAEIYPKMSDSATS